jgi:ankyrin repeat protein
MNKFISAIKSLDLPLVAELLQKKPEWINWAEDDGKDALHYLCGTEISKQPQKASESLALLKLLLKSGMNINSVHRIKDGDCGFFPARPLWYAYAKGRNELLYPWLLANGADPENCMYAIAWNDDVEAAKLFKQYGATTDGDSLIDTPFLAAFNWKRFEVAKWFLENGANINAADPKGNTALHYAVKRKYDIGQIELLLKFGADVNRENKDGISPKKLAETNRQMKILKLLANVG